MAQISPPVTPVGESHHNQAVSPPRVVAAFSIPAAAMIGALGTVLCWRSQYTIDYEMSLLPWLVSRNWVLYKDAVDQHTPLLPIILAFAGAGDPGALHFVIAGLHLAILVLAWVSASLIGGRVAGLLAVLFSEVWLAAFESTHLWYDMALAPLYLAALAVLCIGPLRGARRTLAASVLVGLLVGVATLIKQHALLLLPLCAMALYLQLSEGRRARLAGLAVGFALPMVVAGVYFAANGALNDALYWTVAYSFNGDYLRLSALGPSPGEWPVLAVMYAPVVAALAAWKIGPIASDDQQSRRWRWLMPLLLGLLIIATLPAFPRYGRFHLAAAVPLLGVICGVVLVRLVAYLRANVSGARAIAALGCSLVVASFAWGGFLWTGVQEITARLGTPTAPYSSSIAPLRAWVDSHAQQGAPIAAYGLDPLLYRVLEREPTRPFIPQLPWIIFQDDRQGQVWAGIRAAQPSVALVSSTGWASSAAPGEATIEGRLRYDYHEDRRFSVVAYTGAAPVQVVCLLRNTSGREGNRGDK